MESDKYTKKKISNELCHWSMEVVISQWVWKKIIVVNILIV